MTNTQSIEQKERIEKIDKAMEAIPDFIKNRWCESNQFWCFGCINKGLGRNQLMIEAIPKSS